MFDYQISFGDGWILWLTVLVVLLAVMWIFSFRSLSGLGPWRRIMALVLRSSVLILLILALAEVKLVRTSKRVTVIYLLDLSLSIPPEQRKAMIEYVNQDIFEHRVKKTNDRAGVIVFGRDAAIEIPPFDDDVQVPAVIESYLDTKFTNLDGALRLAQASFPEDAARRIVIVTDGNENIGDAREQARSLSENGIGIDVVPVHLTTRSEITVEKIAIPSDVRRGQPFDLQVVLSASIPKGSGNVKGRLRLVRKTGDHEEVLNEGADQVELGPGKTVYRFRENIDDPDFYTYEARFIPDDPAADAVPQNNRATTFTHVRGRGHVLLIEDAHHKGEFAGLVQRLKSENIAVTVQATDALFQNLAELQRYDSVILANVPRSGGADGDLLGGDDVKHFTDEQIAMLVRNTQQLGSGLIMIGGDRSFGAGGWRGTELEKAMPVEFQIKNTKIKAVGALALLMHACEMPNGNYWEKVVAKKAIQALGPEDYCGLLHWNNGDRWMWGGARGFLKVGGNRQKMLARIGRMQPGDMPQFGPAMQMALRGFKRLPQAAVKHMIVISDGDPSPPSAALLASYKAAKVKVTTVAIGTHGVPDQKVMQRIARVTGGKFYNVRSARALPKIYQREVRRIARSLIYPLDPPLAPRIEYPHEIIKGIDGGFPPIKAFVLTTVKDQAEVALYSPLPVSKRNSTILAAWIYGLGKTVALTTDVGQQWATGWPEWENYDKLMTQMVRWSMRPVGDQGNFTISTDVKEGKARLVVTALDKDDEFINFLDLTGTAIGPDLKPIPIKMRQTAPGRYVGEFDAKDAGSYMVSISPGAGRAQIRTGLAVGYSAEFRQRETNTALLEGLASIAPRGGVAGMMIDGETIEERLEVNPYRRDLPEATSRQDVWHLMLLVGGCLFFFDVFIRRVAVNFAWVAPVAAGIRDTLLRRDRGPVETKTMDRLRSRKAEIVGQLESRHAATRFEPTSETEVPVDVVEEELAGGTAAETTRSRKGPQEGLAPGAGADDDDYTTRLLKAKKKVWQDRKERD